MAAKGKTAPAATAKAVAPAAGKAVAAAGNLKAKMAAHAGKGLEEATRDAFAVPFLRVLQDLSPQVKKKMAGYIEGAKPGQIFNTVSQRLYDPGELRVVPCYFAQNYIEWKPDRGGFVAAHPISTPLVQKATRDGGALVLPNGNNLMDTRSHFVLLLAKHGTRWENEGGALIAMSSTGIKHSRRWASAMNVDTQEYPTYAWSYELGVDEDGNDKGSWYHFTFTDRQMLEDEALFNAALQFHDAMMSGTVKVHYEESDPTPGKGAGGGVPEDLGTGNDIGGM